MARLTMLITESVPGSLRGELSRWMLEVKAGVFIGKLSALVQEKLWKLACKKIKNGGAIIVRATNNEQRFFIEMAGNCDRMIVDHDGLQLVKFPFSEKKLERKKNRLLKKKARPPAKPVEKRHARHPGFPAGYIERHVFCHDDAGQPRLVQGAKSSHDEYNDKDAWEKAWMGDIEAFTAGILKLCKNKKIARAVKGKKILALDIETTVYIPKAYEGFVNVLGIAILDARRIDEKAPVLFLHQGFNMSRKKDRAKYLLELAWKFMRDHDDLVVFNRHFDIDILERIIADNGLKIQFSGNIVDLMERYPSLKTLEQKLKLVSGLERTQTRKEDFSHYYDLFKGKGTRGKEKKIEPIGAYNAIDVLSPLAMYLLEFLYSREDDTRESNK